MHESTVLTTRHKRTPALGRKDSSRERARVAGLTKRSSDPFGSSEYAPVLSDQRPFAWFGVHLTRHTCRLHSSRTELGGGTTDLIIADWSVPPSTATALRPLSTGHPGIVTGP